LFLVSKFVVLGIPAIHIDQVGRGYTDEEAREGLLYMFRPVPTRADLIGDRRQATGDRVEPSWILGGRKESIEKALEIADWTEQDHQAWKSRHAAWMATKFDCTAWLTWFIENYPDSERQWRENRNEIEMRFK